MLVVKQQWVHLDYMKNKKDMHFNIILGACEFRGISHLLTYHHNWNQEVIIEFYSTIYFDKKEMILYG
jgi:hypothetical protein